MNANMEKAFDFAQEATKQLIALATGVVALTITFLTDVAKDAPGSAISFLQAAWVVYLVSIVFGIFTLLSLTGSLGSQEEDPSIYAKNVVAFSLLQVLSFATALGLTLVFGFKAV